MDKDLDSLGESYVLIEESRKVRAQLLDTILKELRAILRNPTAQNLVDEAKKERTLRTLLPMLNEPELELDSVLKCFVLLGMVDNVGKRLHGVLQDEHEGRRAEAYNGIMTLIKNMATLPSQFVMVFVPALVGLIRTHINQDNVKESLALLCAFMQASPSLLGTYHMRFIGQRHFDLGIELGQGKFGVVTKGVNKYDGTPVAIKKIDKQALTRGKSSDQVAKIAKMLKNEIDVMQHMSNSNTVTLYEMAEQEQCIYLVTEFMAGGDFGQYLNRMKRLSEEEARYWLKQLAAGLRYMRSRGVVHRDLKPDNFLLSSADAKGVLKLADFGLARFLGAESMAETTVGTPLYMGPEVLEFKPYTDKADLWSVGVIVYEMLTGTQPYTAKNLLQLIETIRRRSVEFPPSVPLTPDMKDLLLRLLQRDPATRIQWDDFFSHPAVALAPLDEEPEGEGGAKSAELQEKQKRIEELEAQLRDITEKFKEAEKSTKALEDANARIQSLTEQHEKEKQKIVADLEAKCNDSRNALDKLNETAKKEREQFESNIKRLQDENVAMKRKVQLEDSDRDRSISEQQLFVAELTSQCQDAQKALEARTEEKKQLETQVAQITATLKEKEAAASQLAAARDELTAELLQASQRIKAQDKAHAGVVEENQKLNARLAETVAALKQKEEEMAGLRARLSEVQSSPKATPSHSLEGLKLSITPSSLQVLYKENKAYPLVVHKFEFLAEGNIKVYFDARGDQTNGNVPWNASAAKLVLINRVGRYEDSDAVAYDSAVQLQSATRVMGHILFLVPHFTQNMRYAFVYHEGYPAVPLFSF